MSFIDSLESSRGFWYVAVGFLYFAAALQFVLKDFLLGFIAFGMAIVFTSVAYQKLKEE